MKLIATRCLLVLLSVVTILMALPRPANAVLITAYVSYLGDDGNNCARPGPNTSTNGLPCNSFEQALTTIVDGGTIICVDPSSFASLGIVLTKSVTIDCRAAENAVAIAGTVTINAPGKSVTLRNIKIDVASFATSFSIDIIAAASVRIENAIIGGATNAGIRDRRTGPGKLFVSNTLVKGNGGPGILIAPQAGSVISATFDNVSAQENSYGLAVAAGSRVMIERSKFSGNATAGVEADAGAFIGLNSSLVSGNATGVIAGGTVAISNNDINSNNVGISGATQSAGNNRFFANASSDGTTPTAVNQH